ncbi:MAG: hypothetical protein GY811_24265 [Myxococcales bacterium]|nr:hypothetical protein [Myxococcales bacterium]
MGRIRELSELFEALTGSPLLVVNGAVGSGKTRLAGELAKQVEGSLLGDGTLQVTRVACAPGDLGIAVVARCERAMDRMPGSLDSVLHNEPHLVIVDDVHHLPPMDVVRLVASVADRPGAGRLLLLTRDILPIPRGDARQFSLTLEGLEEGSARDLWFHLEETYGPTRQEAFAAAIGKTRGMPLAMRREYARSRYGADAWELEELSAEARAALEAICVVNLAAAPAAIAAVMDRDSPESALIDLVSRQLIDPLESGRFGVHDVVRDQVLAAIAPSLRATLELRAIAVLRGLGRGNGPERPAWNAGDDGAIALMDPVERSREIVVHLIAAGEHDAAGDALIECARGALARGAGGEVLAQIEKLRSLGVASNGLARVEAQIAIRHGRFADALELSEVLDRRTLAFLQFRTGQIATARTMLDAVLAEDSESSANDMAQAAATMAELEIACGNINAAEACLSRAFEERGQLSGAARAVLHLAFAQLESHRGNPSGARAALSRAANGADDGEMAARVEVSRVRNLIDELRYREARELRVQAELSVCEVDCVPLRDELSRCVALVESSVGNARDAGAILREIVAAARQRGDEIGALRADIELARGLVAIGELSNAAELTDAVASTAGRYGLRSLVAQAELVNAHIGLVELRIEHVAEFIGTIDVDVLPYEDLSRLAAIHREINAWSGVETKEEAQSDLEIARLALARNDAAGALSAARRSAVQAERLGYGRILSLSLAMVARLELSRGQRKAAGEAAARAARAAQASACTEAQIQALLVLSALARDQSNVRDAATYARDARGLASEAVSPMLLLVAVRALEVIAEDGNDFGESRLNASTATASRWARAASDSMLSDLGFSSARPYRCVSATGSESFVASASAGLLGMGERSLSVDAVRQLIVRRGETTADLRRRSLLKRLLFLFAGHPGTIFSKEEIVEKVWQVEYHPLRHDAALFTNIMRIRRLLGDDANELISVSEEGYAMVPPADYLYVEETALP